MKLLVTTTLSPNQLRAHLDPIVAIPEVEEIVLVTDEEPPALPKLVGVVPSRRERRLLGRAGSKLVESARLARQLRPAWVLSYSIMPHAVNGLVAGRFSGSRTIYHMIGGEREWRGGGWESENALLGRLPRPLPTLERVLLGVMRRTDIVCTMGTKARRLLIAAGLNPSRVIVTPPSVDTDRFSPVSDPTPKYELVTVGRLHATKRLVDFISVVARLRLTHPDIRAAIAGTGELESQLRAEATRQGVGDSIDFLGLRHDIENVYRSARIFVLTSGHEGLSVAMTEAMACGLPVVATDVGDLCDLVDDGGHLVPVGDVSAIAQRVGTLLGNDCRYRTASAAARRAAVEHADIKKLTAVYREILIGAPARTE